MFGRGRDPHATGRRLRPLAVWLPGAVDLMLRGLMEKRRRKPAEPMLIGDHTLDFTAEDFTRPPLIVVPPEIVHLAAHLDGFSPERWTVLAESETPNGFPICFRRWYSRDGWEAFKDTCLDALLNRYEESRSSTH